MLCGCGCAFAWLSCQHVNRQLQPDSSLTPHVVSCHWWLRGTDAARAFLCWLMNPFLAPSPAARDTWLASKKARMCVYVRASQLSACFTYVPCRLTAPTASYSNAAEEGPITHSLAVRPVCALMLTQLIELSARTFAQCHHTSWLLGGASIVPPTCHTPHTLKDACTREFVCTSLRKSLLLPLLCQLALKRQQQQQQCVFRRTQSLNICVHNA